MAMTEGIDNSVFSDLAQLERSLSEDSSGDRARSMLSYFDTVTKSSEDMLKTAMVDTERQLVSQLVEGFRAAQRIIRHVWEAQHSSVLPA
jgi:hypothetical protein